MVIFKSVCAFSKTFCKQGILQYMWNGRDCHSRGRLYGGVTLLYRKFKKVTEKTWLGSKRICCIKIKIDCIDFKYFTFICHVMYLIILMII